MKKLNYLFVFLFLTLAMGFVSATTLTNGLISYYKLDETSGTIVTDSLNNNNSTNNNTTIIKQEK